MNTNVIGGRLYLAMSIYIPCKPSKANYPSFLQHTPGNSYKDENPYNTHKNTVELCKKSKKLPDWSINESSARFVLS